MSEIKWEHDCKTCLYNTEPKAGACEECGQNMVWKAGDKFVSADELKTLSTDWVLVVRCKNCKWWQNGHCLSWEYNHSDADDYCSFGERREDG